MQPLICAFYCRCVGFYAPEDVVFCSAYDGDPLASESQEGVLAFRKLDKLIRRSLRGAAVHH